MGLTGHVAQCLTMTRIASSVEGAGLDFTPAAKSHGVDCSPDTPLHCGRPPVRRFLPWRHRRVESSSGDDEVVGGGGGAPVPKPATITTSADEPPVGSNHSPCPVVS